MGARHIHLGGLMEPADHPDLTGKASFGRGRLSAAASQAARDQTRLQASQHAVASEVIAFQVLQQRAQLASGAEIDPARLAASLSHREREVIGLVATGRSDGEIASELFISKKTASVHVANIKSKLGASSRVEIAMLAAKLHLVPDGVATGEAPHVTAASGSPAVVCPFKGLASFDVGDGGYFFGRERVVAELVARLAATTFLAVVGPSGSGKSSVVRAGLVPALRAGVLPGSDEWRLAVLRPGAHPLDALGRALRRAMDDAEAVDDEHAAEEWLDRLPTGGRLVVVVDQFEEAYTVCRDAPERTQFLDRLAVLARDAERRALVIIAIRSEFYGRCAEHGEIADLVGTSTVLLGPMTADELTRAIELPARAAALRMDTTLVPALVTDVLQQPGGLPMLSSTLLELWQRREGRSLRMDTYRALGGISGAVGRVAETVFGRLSADDQAIARSIFLRLATVGDNGIASRRRIPLGEIDAGRNPDSTRVVAALVDGRLLTVDDGFVEPAHEALLREWPRMRQWLDEDTQARRIREHLSRTAREWGETGRDHGELYRGPRLGSALEWAATRRAELTDLEREFLDASSEASEWELAGQRRSNVRLRALLGAVAVLLVVALGAGALALGQAQTARSLADEARTSADKAEVSASNARASETYARVRELVASSRAAIATDPSLARLLGVAAADLLPPDVETEAVLHEAWMNDVVVQRLAAPSDGRRGLVADVDPDGRRLAEVWGDDGAGGSLLDVLDLVSGERLWSHRFSTPGTALDQAYFSLDGSRVITNLRWVDPAHAPPPGQLGILVFDAATGAPLDRLDMGACGALLTGVSAAGYLVVLLPDDAAPGCYGDEDPAYDGDVFRPVALMDPVTGATRIVAERHAGDVTVSRNGKVLAYTTPDEIAVTTDLETGKVLARVDVRSALPQRDGGFRAISPDGTLALYGDRPQFLLNTASGIAVRSLHDSAGESWGGAFSLAGDVAFTSGRDAVVRVWDATGEQLFAVAGVPGGSVLPTRDGRAIVVAEDGNVAIADPRPRGEASGVRTCRGFFPAGGLKIAGAFAAVGGDCQADEGQLYGIQLTPTPRQAWTLGDHAGQHVAVSSDGTLVARQRQETLGVEIVDAATGRRVTQLRGTCTWDSPTPAGRWRSPGCREFPAEPFPFWAQDLQFTPDGSVLAGLDPIDGYVVVWDTASGRVIATLDPGGWEGILFTTDGDELIVGTRRGELLVYSTASWKLLRTVAGGESVTGSLSPVAFVDGGRTLVAAAGITDEVGASVHLLDLATHEVVASRTVHTANLKAATVSPSGKLIATSAADGRVRVWDAQTLTLQHELRIPGQAQGVAFVDERHVAVTPQTGDVLIMILDREELLAKVRSTLTRGFTRDECELYGFGSVCPTLDQMRDGPALRP